MLIMHYGFKQQVKLTYSVWRQVILGNSVLDLTSDCFVWLKKQSGIGMGKKFGG